LSEILLLLLAVVDFNVFLGILSRRAAGDREEETAVEKEQSRS
jgi:hypothetical protein